MREPGSALVMPTLDARIDRTFDEVARAARSSGRAPEDITVVAVTKSVDRAAVDAAVALGLRHFGENRVQDANLKFATPLPEPCALHMIGQLQSNKAKPAVALFSMVESVDRASLIDALEKAALQLGEQVPVLLQVNVAREPQKAGCDPDEVASLLRRLASSDWLLLEGLMTIAPLVVDPEEVRPIFKGLRELRDELQRLYPTTVLKTLSMGMSNDFRVAIEEGATSVRIGRAIFGG